MLKVLGELTTGSGDGDDTGPDLNGHWESYSVSVPIPSSLHSAKFPQSMFPRSFSELHHNFLGRAFLLFLTPP